MKKRTKNHDAISDFNEDKKRKVLDELFKAQEDDPKIREKMINAFLSDDQEGADFLINHNIARIAKNEGISLEEAEKVVNEKFFEARLRRDALFSEAYNPHNILIAAKNLDENEENPLYPKNFLKQFQRAERDFASFLIRNDSDKNIALNKLYDLVINGEKI